MSAGFLHGTDPTFGGDRLDRFDPRSRVLAAGVAVIAVVALRSTTVLAALLPILLVGARLSGLRIGELARRLAHLEGFLLAVVILLPLTVPGPEAARIGPFVVSETGLSRSATLFLRINATAIVLVTLLAGLEPIRLGHALARLGAPEKLVHLLLFTARWIGLFGTEARRLEEAMRVRAYRARATTHGLRTLGAFVGQLLVRAFERAERVEEAMRCRAFSGRFALVDTTGFSRRDAVLIGGVAVGLLALLVVDRAT